MALTLHFSGEGPMRNKQLLNSLHKHCKTVGLCHCNAIFRCIISDHIPYSDHILNTKHIYMLHCLTTSVLSGASRILSLKVGLLALLLPSILDLLLNSAL